MLLTWGCVACEPAVDPDPQDFVTYTLEANHEAWMFASDADGKVLASAELVYREPVALGAVDPPEIFSLSIVRRLTANGNQLDITTYTGVSSGTIFNPKIYQDEEVNRLNSLGKSTVMVTNYPLSQALPLIISDPWQSNSYFSSGQATPTFAMNVWQTQQPKVMFTAYKDDLLHPVYKLVDAVDVGATLAADFTTFVPFQKTIELRGFDTSLEGRVNFQLYGLSGEQTSGYKMANVDWVYNGTSPLVKVGYLDDFSEYYMSLWVYEVERQPTRLRKSLNYTHTGPINTTVQVPDDELAVTDASLATFAFDFTGDYSMREHLFTYVTAVSAFTWIVYSANGESGKIVDVPSTLTDQFPALNPKSMQHSSSAFYKFDDGFDYSKALAEKLKVSFGPEHAGYVQTFY